MIKVDVTESQYQIIKDILEACLPYSTKVSVFGSRATYTTKKSSDLDIALQYKEEFPADIMLKLKEAFDESDLPYSVDLVDINTIDESFYNAIKSDFIDFPVVILPRGWEEKTLKDIADVIGGGTPSTKNPDFWGGNIPWLSPKDLSNYSDKYISHGAKNITDLGLQKSSARLLPKGSILVSSRAPIGYVAIAENDIATNQGFKSLVLKNGDSPEYFYYWVIASRKLLNDLGTGATFKEISGKTLGNIDIPIPPLPEQKQIVATLDKAFVAIDQAKANIEQNIQNSKELFQSKLNQIFTQKGEDWEEKTLDEVCSIEKSKHSGHSSIYIGMEDISSGQNIFLGDMAPRQVKSDTFKFGAEHILYGRLRPYLNKCLTPDFSGHCSTEIFPILPNESVDKWFLYYWLTNEKTVEKINKTCTGARMPRANMNDVIKFKISLPSIVDQQQIVTELDNLKEQTQQLENNYQQELQNLEELKKSILQKAFLGELA